MHKVATKCNLLFCLQNISRAAKVPLNLRIYQMYLTNLFNNQWAGHKYLKFVFSCLGVTDQLSHELFTFIIQEEC